MENIIIEKEGYLGEITQEKSEALIVAFRRKRDTEGLTEEMIEEIKENLKDFGKWKEYKKLKKNLEN